MARTTSIELKGDRYKARQLSLAHTNRLLEKFRGFNDFNKLMTNSHREDFFDDTGAYIGSIKMQTIFGTEKVIVEVGAGKPVRKQELWRDKRRQIDQIVPVMRSTDNLYWVVCLSGTFEPPYIVFQNIYDIPAEDMDDVYERESGLDKKLISVLNEKQLFFIAQTGTIPDMGTGEALTGDISAIYDTRYDTNNYGVLSLAYFTSLVGDEIQCEIEYYPWSYYSYDVNFSYSDIFYITTTAWGEPLLVPQRSFYRDTTMAGEGASQYSTQVDVDLNFWGEHLSTREYSIPTIVSASIEREVVANFACCYAQTEIISSIQRDAVSATCAEKYRDDPPPDNENTVRRKPYYFQVDAASYKFYDTPEKTEDLESWELDGYPYRWSEYPPGVLCYVEENMLKYYGADDPADPTGIMCGRIESSEQDEESGEYINEQCLEFIYNYVGPNNQNEITTTRFVPEADTYEHIIPDIGLPADTRFKGEIFLALLRTTTEDTVQIL